MSLGFFSRKESDNQDDFIEVDTLGLAERSSGAIGVKVEKLNEFEDTERILKAVRTGHIVFLKIKGLKEKDIGELKRCVDKLKKTIVANNGDIVGIEQDWLVLTPEFARVVRD